MLEKKEFESLRYEGGIEFPRWISGDEALGVFREVASKHDLHFNYRFINEDFVIYNGKEESVVQDVELFGTLTKDLGCGEGNIFSTMFYNSALSGGDMFAGCLIGNRYDFTKKDPELMKRCLSTAKNYADTNFKGTVVSRYEGKDIRAKSSIFDRGEIERGEEKMRRVGSRGTGKLICTLAGIGTS